MKAADPKSFKSPGSFDPAAWLAEYEALGGRANVMQRPDGQWFGMTIPRGGAASHLQMAIAPPQNREAVADLVAARDGVMPVPAGAVS
jgi:hypothetical protein